MAQVEILQRLADEPGLRVTELAERHRLATNTVSNLTQQMVVAGLVARHEDSRDRRAVTLELTATGREHLQGWMAANSRRLDAALRRSPSTGPTSNPGRPPVARPSGGAARAGRRRRRERRGPSISVNEPSTQSPNAVAEEIPFGLLIAGVVVMAGVVLAAACLGWAGIVVIATVLIGAYALLLRWSRWSRRTP